MRAIFPGGEISTPHTGIDMGRRSAFGLFEDEGTNYKDQETLQERKLLESNIEIKKLVKELEKKDNETST